MSDKITQSAKKTLLIFEELIRKEEVVDFVKKLRKELNLPTEGLAFTDEDTKAISAPIEAFLYVPERAVRMSKSTDKYKAMKACNVFAREQGYSSMYIGTLLRFYVFFNQTMDFIMKMFETYNEYLRVEHLPSELSGWGYERAYDHFDAVSKKYPIVMFINPEVSQRQIQDFISHNWAFIQAHRENKEVNSYRKKKKKIQERNDFIYKNRHLPRKEIMMKITDKYGSENTVDYGYIGKIISLEKKRRENK
jgi:hypothetical protein